MSENVGISIQLEEWSWSSIEETWGNGLRLHCLEVKIKAQLG